MIRPPFRRKFDYSQYQRKEVVTAFAYALGVTAMNFTKRWNKEQLVRELERRGPVTRKRAQEYLTGEIYWRVY